MLIATGAASRIRTAIVVVSSILVATRQQQLHAFSFSSSSSSRILSTSSSERRRRRPSSSRRHPRQQPLRPRQSSGSSVLGFGVGGHGHCSRYGNDSSYSELHRRRGSRSGTRGRRRCTSTTSLASSSTPDSFGDVVVVDDDEEEEDREELINRLREENRSLQERLRLSQIKNDQLEKHQPNMQHAQADDIPGGGTRPGGAQQQVVAYEQRLILEDFEGEGTPSVDARGRPVDGWNGRERRYTEPWDDEDENEKNSSSSSSLSSRSSGGDVAPTSSSSSSSVMAAAEDEACEYDPESDRWTNGIGECPVEPDVTFADAMKSRAAWLVGLLAMQSCSGFILSRNELLLQDHPVIVYFLTMLVGAGGNAGNQASVRVIRGLALGTLNSETQSRFLSRELRMAFALSLILSAAGFVRAIAFRTPLPETLAVTTTLSVIVFTSICLGAVLPLLLQRVGVDPAHSSTTIQVVMDILGVILTVFVSTLVLDSGWGKALIGTLGSKLGF